MSSRPSRYNIRAVTPDGRPRWANTRSGVAGDASAEVDAVLDGRAEVATLDATTRSQLEAAGLLVDVSPDVERQQVMDRYRDAAGEDELALTLSPTVACNLRCTYCFEADHPNRRMDDPDMAAVVDLVRRRLAAGASHLHVTWFGGEPLLHFDGLATLSRALRSLCTFTGATYSASIVTNGTLLDSARAAHLARLGVREAQISLDGPQTSHDRLRVNAAGAGSYDRVIAGLVAAQDHLRTIVRVQVDRSNAEGVEHLLEQLVAHGCTRVLPTFVRLEPPQVYRDDGAVDRRYLSVREFARLEARWLAYARSLGFAVSTPVAGGPLPCAAVQRGHLAIEPGGAVGRCWADVGDPTGMVGRLDADGLHLDDRDDQWARYLPFDLGCADCAFLPQCVGGCPKARLSGALRSPDGDAGNGGAAAEGATDDEARRRFKEQYVCSPRKFNLTDLLARGLVT